MKDVALKTTIATLMLALAVAVLLALTLALAAAPANAGPTCDDINPTCTPKYKVTAWHSGNARYAPYTWANPPTGYVYAGHTYGAYCWTYGQTINASGYTNNIWIATDLGYTTAIFFKGDNRANLPVSAQC